MAEKKQRRARSGSVDHTVRTADGRYIELKLTRKLAMSAFCTQCLGFEEDPANCTAVHCPLFPFRAKTLATRYGTMDDPEQSEGVSQSALVLADGQKVDREKLIRRLSEDREVPNSFKI